MRLLTYCGRLFWGNCKSNGEFSNWWVSKIQYSDVTHAAPQWHRRHEANKLGNVGEVQETALDGLAVSITEC